MPSFKKSILFSLFMALTVGANAQVYWNQTGDNTMSGRILISGSTTSVGYDDISITRNKADAGITLFNQNVAGRSVILFGQGFSGRYGYLAHHGEIYNAATGYTQTYKPNSTVIMGAATNGLGIISTGDIRFNTGGDQDINKRMVISSTGTVEVEKNIVAHGDIEIGRGDGQDTKLLFHNHNAGWYSVGRDVSDSKFKINAGGTLGETTHFTMDWLGNIGIGTNTTGSFKLAVEGKIGAREINVLVGPFPDYVFDENYDLPTLAELEAYIKVNKHLPEVPSACVVEENGVNLGEMNMILLKKVEELTLYLIEQQKTNKEQSERISQLEEIIKEKLKN